MEEILLEGSNSSGDAVRQKARGLTSLHADYKKLIPLEDFEVFC